MSNINDICTVAVSDAYHVASKVFKMTFVLNSYIHFFPGQYLKLWYREDIYRCYSIAAPFYHKEKIEIFIGYNNEDSLAAQIIENILADKVASISLPYGEAYYHSSHSDYICIITCGTGYAYGRCILLHALRAYSHKKIYFWWFVRNKDDVIKEDHDWLFNSQHENLDFSINIANDTELIPILHHEINKHENNQIFKFDEIDIFLAGSQQAVKSINRFFMDIGNDHLKVYSDHIFSSQEAYI